MLGWLVTVPLMLIRWLISPVILAVLVLLMTWIYYILTKNFDFWKSRGVSGPKPRFPWGTEFGSPFWTSPIELDAWVYSQHGGRKFCGYFEFNRPVLFVGDLELIRYITIKDFEYFTDRRDQGFFENLKDAVSVLKGAHWKETRSVMSSSFSTSKLKAMYQLALGNAKNLTHYVLLDMEKKGEVDMKDMFGRFTMDNIASCAFGVNCNSFTDPNSTFATNAAKLFSTERAAIMRLINDLALPECIKSRLPDPLAEPSQFFADVVTRTIRSRDNSTHSAPDFLQLLMDTKDKEGNRVLSTSSIISQSVLFLFVGYDTTASLLTFAGYCLATHPEVQERVQEEVDAALSRHGDLTYAALQEMSYLDRVMSETLRLYPPATRLERESTKEYTLPGTDVHLPIGTVVQISVLSIHRDPEYYPDPLRFDPDRFLPEEKERRHPCAYLPFGSGPRNCLAMRFALFEAKVALAELMRQMTLKPTACTPSPPMPLDKMAFLLTPAGRKMPLISVPRSSAK
ncbi:probable cytochrome P450 6a13 [Amphibalanus amphitrite]|nr:probable cytochrome P450 6a13 [Amphibalanus amphitrite]